MIEWFAWVQVGVAVVAGVLCLTLGFAGRVPSDLTNGALVLVELLLLVQELAASREERPRAGALYVTREEKSREQRREGTRC